MLTYSVLMRPRCKFMNRGGPLAGVSGTLIVFGYSDGISPSHCIAGPVGAVRGFKEYEEFLNPPHPLRGVFVLVTLKIPTDCLFEAFS